MNITITRTALLVDAYLLAVTAAAITFPVLLEGSAMISNGGFETATTDDLITKLAHLSIMSFLFFVIGWLLAFVTALIPFIAGIAIIKRLKSSHWVYFVAGSVLTAVGFIPLYISIPNLGINEVYPEPSFEQKYLRALPYFLMSGSAAGATCWFYLQRKFRKTEPDISN
ncbi:MAG TPA: hypothetical protein VIE69_04095 [Methylophilaceae bacterium]